MPLQIGNNGSKCKVSVFQGEKVEYTFFYRIFALFLKSKIVTPLYTGKHF